ncbi:MAG: ArnT family glycosyltransferase, partial [Chloroflexia bacterium]
EDRRLLGVQVDRVRLEAGCSWGPVRPGWRSLFLWAGVVGLIGGSLERRRPRLAGWITGALVVGIVLGLAFLRPWLTAFAGWSLIAAGAIFVAAHGSWLFGYLRRLARRARPFAFLATLACALLLLLLGYVRWAVRAVPYMAPRPDAIAAVVFFALAVVYAAWMLEAPLRRWASGLERALRHPWPAGVFLFFLLAGVTVYEAQFVRQMRFIGHADYADNAVVARNLLVGRGFAVDYVTQFYRFYPGLSHPQETWPLLQPVLIAPFFRLLGDSPAAAKVPNLLLQVGLALALYALASRWMDRRVGLVAVLLTLLNPFIFRLIIFPTSDLAFTLFALLTLGQFFRASEREREQRRYVSSYIWAGVWAGLMMLAKPNGALFVSICLVWDLYHRLREGRRRALPRAWLAFGVPAALLFTPWVVRNLVLFGQPVFSTERFDAWILKYRDWEEIYRIYCLDPTRCDLPDRSWLLRHGFDRVLQAIGTEFRRWWNYFSRDGGSLLRLLGSALALWGGLTLGREATGEKERAPMRLYGLVVAVLVGFSLFICTYWHVEERYFVPFIPWLALLVSRALWWFHDVLAYRRAETGHLTPSPVGWLGLVLVVLACAHLVQPFFGEIAEKRLMDQEKQEELRAYAWLVEHTSPDDVVMTRVPWQLTYYTHRRSVMIPQGTLEDALDVARRYGVTVLFWEGNARSLRPALREALGSGRWSLLYDAGGIQIYRFPDEG